MSLPSSVERSDIQLPPELWEKIVDILSEYPNPSWRRDVYTCCLVCRAFTPRCRFQLYQAIDLRSAANLAQVVDILTQFPILCQRVGQLIIDTTTSTDQSWVSTVPFYLPLPKFTTQIGLILHLRGVDLNLIHPNTHRAFTRIPRYNGVVLDDVQYSSIQFARFCTISDRVDVVYQNDSPRLVAVPNIGRLPRRALRGYYQWGLCYTDFGFVMPWETLGRITQRMDLSAPADVNERCIIHFIGEWPTTQEASATALRNVRKAFRHICWQPGHIPCIDIGVGRWRIKLGRVSLTTRASIYLQIIATNLTADGHTSGIAHFLTSLSMGVYDSLGIHVVNPVDGLSPPLTHELIGHWKCIDTALTRYTSINRFEVSYEEDAALPQDNEYACIADLFRDLLPEFTSRVSPETECHTGPDRRICAYHRRAEDKKRQRELERSAT